MNEILLFDTGTTTVTNTVPKVVTVTTAATALDTVSLTDIDLPIRRSSTRISRPTASNSYSNIFALNFIKFVDCKNKGTLQLPKSSPNKRPTHRIRLFPRSKIPHVHTPAKSSLEIPMNSFFGRNYKPGALTSPTVTVKGERTHLRAGTARVAPLTRRALSSIG